MSTPTTQKLTKQHLIDWLQSGCLTSGNGYIGVEHEKFCVIPDSNASHGYRPISYDGANGISALLTHLHDLQGGDLMKEGEKIVGLSYDRASVTLEPAGQVELSGAPLQCLHQCHDELMKHLHYMQAVCDDLGIIMVGTGFHPTASRDDVHWMPKGRYAIMRRQMQKMGNLGLDMMTRTCTVQVNLDYKSEMDMVEKMRIAMALQPMATALFANSSLMDGKPNGYQSYRSHIWTDTDPTRCGILSFVFDDNFGFERWVDYVLDVPMYFVYRDGVYHDVAGLSFRDFMDGKLQGFEGQYPTMKDWEDHCTTNFPEVRLKKFIEMRGADSGCRDSLMALPALWVGLLYDKQSQQQCLDLIADWTVTDIEKMRDNVPKMGLKTPSPVGSMQDLAKTVVNIAHDGLVRRGNCGADDNPITEVKFLNWLQNVAQTGRTGADIMLEKQAKDPSLAFLFNGECF